MSNEQVKGSYTSLLNNYLGFLEPDPTPTDMLMEIMISASKKM